MAKGRSTKVKSSPPKKVNRAQKKKPKPAASAANGACELPPPSPIRGLLPVPPEVARLVAREVKERPMTEEARRMVTRCFLLQYYFGGHEVVYREAEQGVEVLAAGMDEVTRIYREVPPDQHRGMILGYPPPW